MFRKMMLISSLLLLALASSCQIEAFNFTEGTHLTEQARAAGEARLMTALAAQTLTAQAVPPLTTPTATKPPTIPTATKPPTITPTPQGCQPAEPSPFKFNTTDGREVTGNFYGPQDDGAPVAMVMGNDRSLADQMARLIQARVALGWMGDDTAMQLRLMRGISWAAGVLYSMFFDDAKEPLLDAKAAVETARTLPCVDPQAVVPVGLGEAGSAAAYSCWQLNKEYPGACPMAMAVKPKGYLEDEFIFFLQQLNKENPDALFFCVSDDEVDNCKKIANEKNVKIVVVPGINQGTSMVLSEEFYKAMEDQGFWAFFGGQP